METDKPTATLVYIGRRYSDKKIYYFYYSLTDPGNDVVIENNGDPIREITKTCSYIKSTHAAVGNVYQFECVPEGTKSIYLNTIKYVERWKNKEDCQLWATADRSAQMQLDAIRLYKKQKNNDAFIEAVQPLKQIYRRLSAIQRNAFLLMIVSEMKSDRVFQDTED